jgi:hypothetical protein
MKTATNRQQQARDAEQQVGAVPGSSAGERVRVNQTPANI